MRKLTRPSLGIHTQRYFDEWTKKITRKRLPKRRRQEAHRLWKHGRPTVAVRDAVELLRHMNDGLVTCMYCEHDHATAFKNGTWRAIIEHWEPIDRTPERTFDWDNHFLSCHRCNSFLKGVDFPVDAAGQPALLHPATDNPSDHLELEPTNGRLMARNGSLKGDATITLFQLNAFDKSRRAVWDFLVKELKAYDRVIAGGDSTWADAIKRDILGCDHRSLLGFLVDIALGPSGAVLTAPDIPDIVRRHNVGSWR